MSRLKEVELIKCLYLDHLFVLDGSFSWDSWFGHQQKAAFLEKELSLSMLLGAAWVCSTKGHHGHLCNGCKVHGAGCCLCGSVQLWRVTPGALFQHSGVRWDVPRDGTVRSTCTTCPVNAMALLLASSFSWQPSCFQRDSSGHSYSNVFVWLKWLVLNHHMYIFSEPGIWLWHRKSMTLLAKEGQR